MHPGAGGRKCSKNKAVSIPPLPVAGRRSCPAASKPGPKMGPDRHLRLYLRFNSSWAVWAGGADPKRLLLFPVGIELLEKRDQVAGLLLVLQSGINHLGTRDFRFRVLDVVAEGSLIPGDARILVRVRIRIAGRAARLAADDAIEDRSNRIFGIVADLMAHLAHAKDLLSGGGILGSDFTSAGDRE